MAFRPTAFGKYVLLKRIAIGGMAEVFRAKAFGAEGFEKLAAVKRMLPHLSNDSQFVDMFINEAKLAANLNHANIAQIYDFGCIDNLYFISMEYIHGKDIADIIRVLRERNLTTPLELACHVFIDVLNGLDYAHRLKDAYGNPLGLIHRDMSPHNVLLSYEGEVKLVDFGIAKAASSTVHTTGGVLKGKYSYMSPEQAHGMALDHRSDIFSLGICFFELLTLTKMFHAESDLGVLEKVRETSFPRPCEVNENIPEEIEDIILKALEKNPDDRYATAGEWRDRLERFLFERNLHYSTSWLASFMREIFREELDREDADFIEEAEVVQKLRSEARRAARIEYSPLAGSDTVVINKGTGDSSEDFMDGPGERETQEAKSYSGDTFTRERLQEEPDESDEPLEVPADEVIEVGEEEIEEIEGDDDDEYLETAKMERPDPALFRKFAGDFDVGRKRRSVVPSLAPIREVRGPDFDDTIDDSFSDSGADTDKHKRDELRFLLDSTEPERSNSAAHPLATLDFEKNRSTVPEGKQGYVSKGPLTERDATPFDGSPPKGFPFGILFTILLVAVVAGGLAAFYLHSGQGTEKDAIDGGSNPSLLGNLPERHAIDAGRSSIKTPADDDKPASLKHLAAPDAGQTERAVAKDDAGGLVSGKDGGTADTKASTKKHSATPGVAVKKSTTTSRNVKKKQTSTRRKRTKRQKRRRNKVASRPVRTESGFGKVDVGISGSWAYVYIDGEKIRATPLFNYSIKAGRHVIELKNVDNNLIRRWRVRIRADKKLKLLHQ